MITMPNNDNVVPFLPILSIPDADAAQAAQAQYRDACFDFERSVRNQIEILREAFDGLTLRYRRGDEIIPVPYTAFFEDMLETALKTGKVDVCFDEEEIVVRLIKLDISRKPKRPKKPIAESDGQKEKDGLNSRASEENEEKKGKTRIIRAQRKREREAADRQRRHDLMVMYGQGAVTFYDDLMRISAGT
jgi:hypothetical protein